MVDESGPTNVVQLVKQFDGSLSTPDRVFNKELKLSWDVVTMIMKYHNFTPDEINAVAHYTTEDDLDLFVDAVFLQFRNLIDAMAFRADDVTSV